MIIYDSSILPSFRPSLVRPSLQRNIITCHYLSFKALIKLTQIIEINWLMMIMMITVLNFWRHSLFRMSANVGQVCVAALLFVMSLVSDSWPSILVWMIDRSSSRHYENYVDNLDENWWRRRDDDGYDGDDDDDENDGCQSMWIMDGDDDESDEANNHCQHDKSKYIFQVVSS